MELIKLIEDLWSHVYQKDVINNNEINLAFAKGILIKRKWWDVCWAQFATEVQCIGSQAHKGHNLSFKSTFKRTRVYMDKRAKLRDKTNSCTTNKEHVGSSNIWHKPNTEMEKENIEDGGNGLELPKLVGDQGMGNEVQVSQTEKIIKEVQNT